MPWLSLAMGALMVALYLGPGPGVLLGRGGLVLPLHAPGDALRGLSAPWIHVDPFHLGGDVALLVFCGTVLEGRMGRVGFSLAFWLGALSGALSDVAWYRGRPTIVAGASGGVMTLLVLAIGWGRGWQRIAAGLGVAAIVMGGWLGPADPAAHVGGGIAGLLLYGTRWARASRTQ